MISRVINRGAVLSVLIAGQSAIAQEATRSLPGSRGSAPREGMIVGGWSSGVKDFFGTAYEQYDARLRYSGDSGTAPMSRVWFTGAQGILSEVFWPTVDRKQVKDSQILVTDGSSFFEEKTHGRHTVEWLEQGVPAFRVRTEDPRGRFVIERLVFADPDRDTVLQKIRLIRNRPGLKFYVLHNAAAADSKVGDSARVSLGHDSVWPQGLYAWQGDEFQALVTDVGFLQMSAGFEGANDGWQDLSTDFKLDSHFETAVDGNVVMTAQLNVPESAGVTDLVWALGFGRDQLAAHSRAQESIQRVDELLGKYTRQWSNYQRSLVDLAAQSTDHGDLFRASVATLKSMEDKMMSGAFVAAPAVPWGQFKEDSADRGARDKDRPRADHMSGYHIVWPRDLYQMATTFLAIGDTQSAKASLNYFKLVQLGPEDGQWSYGPRQSSRDGSFWQNMWVGIEPLWNKSVQVEPYWIQLQMDQTAFPVILAHRLWSAKEIELNQYWSMVSRAADFIVRFGPWTAQERWEENFGASPSTIAAQIAALFLAADMAKAQHDLKRAATYFDTAQAWSQKERDNLEAWTFTTRGRKGNGKYYQRIEGAQSHDQKWDPNDSVTFNIGNDGGAHREADVLDGGFLELVRLGVRAANDYHVLESLPEYDADIRVDTVKGPGFFRYSGDRYNYDDDNGGRQTKGMLWPLLSGERGHYEIQAARERAALEPARLNQDVDAAAVPYIQAIEAFATPSLYVPEQVWDEGARVGKPTGAATPLGWAHGEYIKLLRSRRDRQVFDRVDRVAGFNNLRQNSND